MDSFRKKTKKDHRTIKHVDKGKSNQFIHDMRAIKENIKINELLRTVKINSSMRIKAPRGKKVMENEDLTEDSSEKEPISEQVNCNTSSVVKQEENVCSDTDCSEKDTQENNGSPGQSVLFIEEEQKNLQNNNDINSNTETAEKNNGDIPKVTVEEISEEQEDESKPTIPLDVEENNVSEEVKTRTLPVRNDSTLLRDRKLSLDHTMLSRMQSMSQSEIDLHSMGKSPLERKSSFFRKKMDNFLKNTTEIFRRHSSHYKGQPVQRRGSMSMSLQSLNENDNGRDFNLNCQVDPQGSTTSLQTCSTLGRSSRSEGLDQGSVAGSQSSINGGQTAFTSQPIIASDSIKNLTDPYLQESPLNSRAISMSSGLDSVQAHRRSTRSKRVTWVASESLNNYLKRLIPDENKKDPVYHSQQDLSSIKEVGSYSISKTDTKGRRLSYQRAVSGEDPAPWLKHHDANQKRKIAAAENQETALLLEQLHHFTQFGVPPIRGYTLTHVPEETFWCLSWAERVEEFQEFFEWKLRRKEIDDLDRLHRMRGFEDFRFFHEPFDIRMTPNEEARQAVIRELIVTEAVYIKHLYAIVEVFIASAHALQDSGKLLDINTERLFANIPDILNASLQFFTATFNPMIIDAIANNILFNTEEMYFGFCHFREWFMPYEKYVCGQSKALDYLRSLGSHHNFMIYLQWCHAQAACNRLQLTDIMVKPMQRLTKYSILLRRILQHTENEPERSALVSMDLFASNYVLEVNRSVRQREELEIIDHLNTVIEPYEVESKDEELDRWFRVFANVNLKAPMPNSLPRHSRSLIFQGDLRFKDHLKEMDVRAILLTDMLLICKKQNKGQYQYKIVRPKYMVDKLNFYQRFAKGTNDINGLVFVVVDEVGSGYGAFTLSEPKDKDPSVPPGILKTWELKFREAKLTYELGVWFARNPSRDLSEAELETFSTYPTHSSKGGRLYLEEATMEREARERVATMLHRSCASTEYENSMKTDSFDVDADMSYAAAARMHMHRNPMFRTSTAGSSRQSRLSSFQHSISAHSHDEPQPGPSRCDYRAGTSVEHLIPPQHPSDGVTSITVNVVSESESASVVSVQPVQTEPPPTLQKLQQKSPMSRNSLRVQPSSGAMALVHSLPDLSLEAPRTPSAPHRPAPMSASDKMYQSHQELLLKNRLQSQHQHQYLSPDSRGTSYPPPSPTRASLRRGLAFSYSMKNPPLSKMGHVNSQSTQPDTATASGSSTMSRDERGAINPFLVPTPEKQDKKSPDKKSKHFSSRNKGSGASSSGASSSRSREDRAE